MSDQTPGFLFRQLVADNPPLPVVGTINAYCALLAEKAGHKAIYLSGAGVANASFGLPDLGITQLADVVEDARRSTSVSEVPLLVDVDTGWGSGCNIALRVREAEHAAVAASHLEAQVAAKRCGHRPNKALVSAEEMADSVKAAVMPGRMIHLYSWRAPMPMPARAWPLRSKGPGCMWKMVPT